MPSSKFWKSENGRTEWTIVMKLCIHINTGVALEIVKCHFGLAEALPRFRFEKPWNWPYLLKLFEYFDKIMRYRNVS